MNIENTENQNVVNSVLEYQKFAKEADKKLKKYLKAQAVMYAAKDEWETAQEAANKAVSDLRKVIT